MIRNSEACKLCKHSSGCSEMLRPSGVGGGEALTPDACRHHTCDLGMAEATRAVRKHLRVNNGSVVSKIAFGSSHKPIGTRLIERDGTITSEQGGYFYPTGQKIIIASVFSNWEIP